MTDDLLDLAQRAARAAGALLLERFSEPARGVSAKSTPTDLVSDADRASDELLLGMISGERPDDGFVTEESEGRATSSGLVWVLDPLDGTVNYLFGIPWWCVSVAVEDPQGVVAGVVYHPSMDQMFWAERGGGAFVDGHPIFVSDRNDLATALVATGFAYDARVRSMQADVVARLLPIVRDIRRGGSAALDLAGVACGRFDAYYERRPERWDTAAGSLLVREAGGAYADLPDAGTEESVVLASNRYLHDAIARLLTDPQREELS